MCYHRIRTLIQYASQMKKSLHKGTLTGLNIDFFPHLTKAGLLGIAKIPSLITGNKDLDFDLDGVVVDSYTMPGANLGDATWRDGRVRLGKTATHEVGHWMGLFHPWQGGDCFHDGDYVFDTLIQDRENTDCDPASIHDSCKNLQGLDSAYLTAWPSELLACYADLILFHRHT